jgi:hypothetical protein
MFNFTYFPEGKRTLFIVCITPFVPKTLTRAAFVLILATVPFPEVTVPAVALMVKLPFKAGTFPVTRSLENTRPVTVVGEEII